VPGVVCGECGKGTNVSFRRGTRLADIACPECGKHELHLRSAGQPNRHKGRHYEFCAHCNKRGLHHSHPSFTWVPKHGILPGDAGPFPIGSPACWACDPVPAARVPSRVVMRAAEARLGPKSLWEWPDDNSQDVVEAASKVPAACPVCISVGWRNGQFHTQAYLFERGTALLGNCWRCGHTILLAAMTAGEIADRGPALLAEASRPDSRCAAGHHDEAVAPEGAFTYVLGVRIPVGTRYCARDRCGLILEEG
jgi:hypothetical protein